MGAGNTIVTTGAIAITADGTDGVVEFLVRGVMSRIVQVTNLYTGVLATTRTTTTRVTFGAVELIGAAITVIIQVVAVFMVGLIGQITGATRICQFGDLSLSQRNVVNTNTGQVAAKPLTTIVVAIAHTQVPC